MREKCLHSQCVCVCVCVSLDFWCSIVLYTGSNISILTPKFLGPCPYLSEHLQKFLVQAVHIE